MEGVPSKKKKKKLSIRRAQVHVPDTCGWCESIQDVNWYCNDCQEALCDKCKDGHKRVKTRNDDIVPFKEANKLREAVLAEVCKTHRGKTCDLYCSECDVVICAMCFAEKHKHHAFKTIDEEIGSQKRYMQDQLQTLKFKLQQFDDKISKRHEKSKTFKETVDNIQHTLQTQRLKLKTEIDSIADSISEELSSLVKEEDEKHKQDCISYEQNIKDIKQLIRDVEQNTDKPSSTSLFELTGRLRTTVPLYDVTTETVLPSPPHFAPGKLNRDHLRTMIGTLQVSKLKNKDMGYERKEVEYSKQVRRISTFQVHQQREIYSICPVDDTHVWMSVFDSTELIKVNKKGKVTETVQLDFIPWCLTMTNTEELLITCCGAGSPLIHKLTNDRQVARFTDISPLNAWGISVSDSDEVFVTTHTTTIQVLNMSGERIRQITCGGVGRSVICLTTGNIAVTTGRYLFNCTEVIVINKSDQVIQKWSGELDNGQKIEKTRQCDIAHDRYDRVFVPDYNTDQVYVFSGNERKAKCLLDQKHGVRDLTTVYVDRCGHVWIGCADGTVHVMEL